MQAGSAEAVRPRHAVPAFVLVPRVAKRVRGRPEGRSRVRHRLLGHRAQPAVESPRPAAREESRRRRRRAGQGKERRRQDPARARLHRCAWRHVRRLRQGRSPHAHAGLCQGHGTTGAALSERRRSADLLRARAQHLGFAGRQDLRQPAQGRGHPGSDRQTPAATSRRRALPDSPLRLSGDRRERPRGRPALCQDRPRCGACPAHAVAHLHARRLLAGVDRLQHRSRSVPRRKRPISTISCIPWTTWSMPICSSGRTQKPRP